MWPFKKKKPQTLRDAIFESMYGISTYKMLVNAESELAFLKARLRGIQDRAYLVRKGEAYYVIQAKNGKFSKMMLPFISDEK